MARTFIVLILSSVSALGASEYTQAMYRHAVANASNSPSMVLITLRNAKSGGDETLAVTSESLLRAIGLEYHLPARTFSPADSRTIDEEIRIARSQPQRVFTFSNRVALRELRQYTTADLNQARRFVSSRSRVQLLRELHNEHSPLHMTVRSERPWQRRIACEFSLAHALLERGIAVGVQDMNGMLYSEE